MLRTQKEHQKVKTSSFWCKYDGTGNSRVTNPSCYKTELGVVTSQIELLTRFF